jgi:hypothetical protein
MNVFNSAHIYLLVTSSRVRKTLDIILPCSLGLKGFFLQRGESSLMRAGALQGFGMFDRYNIIDESHTRQAIAQMVGFVQSVDHPVDQGTQKAPMEVGQNSARA